MLYGQFKAILLIFFISLLCTCLSAQVQNRLIYGVASTDPMRGGSMYVIPRDTSKSLGLIRCNMEVNTHTGLDKDGLAPVLSAWEIKKETLCNLNGRCYKYVEGPAYVDRQFYLPILKKVNFNSVFGLVRAWGRFDDIAVINSNMAIDVYKSKTNEIFFAHDTIFSFAIVDDTINSIQIIRSKIDTLYIHNSEIKDLEAIGSFLPDDVTIEDLHLGTNQAYLDLTTYQANPEKICQLTVGLEDISKLKLNYINYQIILPNESIWDIPNKQYDVSYRLSIYKALIEMQKTFGFTNGEEKITKEYKEFEYTKSNNFYGYFINWLDKNWWDYGYSKVLIFRNTLLLFMVFYVINIFLYKKLLRETYAIQAFSEKYRQSYGSKFSNKLRDLVYCLFYTGYIFFGLKLDFDKFKLGNLGFATYILIQFIVGIICLAYITNYIISR